MTVNRVHGNLWMGSAPKCHTRLREQFDVVVLCAMEHQLPATCFRGVEVIHTPLDDTVPIPSGEARLAQRAAMRVAQALQADRRVLVTCWMGRNRSGLVAALALVRLGADPEVAIELVRRARGEHALSNPAFVELIRRGSSGSRDGSHELAR